MERRTKIEVASKTDSEWMSVLSRYWKMEENELSHPFKLIAKFRKSPKKDVNNREYGYFEDVRNLNGDILYYPMGLGAVKIWSQYRESFDNDEFWQINVRIATRQNREKRNNPFMLTMDNAVVGKPTLKFMDKYNKEKLIRRIFDETGSTERDAKNISNALHAIMGDLYTETERFVFELLQNADDQPQDNCTVNVTLKTLNENLLFLHTGKPFSEADVESISSIGDSTKKKDSEKTGYKGIGFKSVFSDAETVFIDSGNFSFAFDKNSPVYPSDADMNVIPWQIKPIWEEKYRLPNEVQKEQEYFSSPVGIALQVGVSNIVKYDHIIPKLLGEPRFVLFLRNIGKIEFQYNNGNSIEIMKTVNNDIITISSDERTENWLIKDYVIKIPKETRDSLQNEKLVPEKLKEATKTKITFAAKIEDGVISPIKDGVLFTYLPTKVDDFHFKFLVNADFLTTASRESIHFKNVWNRFLFSKIGEILIDWIASLADYGNSLSILPFIPYEGDNKLATDFYHSLNESIESKAFIKNLDGQLVTQSQILIDDSGLSNIIGRELFCLIVDSSKSMPYYDNDAESLLDCDICADITKVSIGTVLSNIEDNTEFKKWFKECEEEERLSFFDWLLKHDNNRNHEAIGAVIDKLPIYQFGNDFLTINEVEAESYKIVMRNDIMPLKPIFESCRYSCSRNIDEYSISPLFSKNIKEVTVDDVLSALDNINFYVWLSNAENDVISTLVNWLAEHDTSQALHDKIIQFFYSVPLFKFTGNEREYYEGPLIENSFRAEDIEKDANKIVVTNKIHEVVGILKKVGLECSENVETSPLFPYMSLLKDKEIYERIISKIADALCLDRNLLSKSDKVQLLQHMKNLDGVGEGRLTQIHMFNNESGTCVRCLSNLIPYTQNVPTWLYDYTIAEDESVPELLEYLVKKDEIFNAIIKPHIDELEKNVTLKEIYSYFRDTWTFLFTKQLINSRGTCISILDMVEIQDVESQKFFLQKIERIDINIDKIYVYNDFEYRVISLALNSYNEDELHLLCKKLYVGDRDVASFTVSDDVSFEYHEGKTMTLSLSKLVPDYNETGITQKLKKCLSNFNQTQVEKMLSLKPLSNVEVWKKVDVSNGYTPSSYLFAIYRTRKVRNYFNSYVPSVDLSAQPENWIKELLDLMYDQDVELYNDSFGYRLSKYFSGYFSNEYISDDEAVLSSIERWANTEEKLIYLRNLGVKGEQSKLIKFRKKLISNELIGDSEIESQKDDILATLNYLSKKRLLPLTGENQINVMLAFEPICRFLRVKINKNLLSSDSVEYELEEYVAWKNDQTFKIYIFPNQIPYQLIWKSEEEYIVCDFKKDDYYYDSTEEVLYVNGSCQIRDVLYSLVSLKSIPFTSEDWQKLFYDNLVSKQEVEAKDNEIEGLKAELEKYIKKYGRLIETTVSEKETTGYKEETESSSNSNKEQSEKSGTSISHSPEEIKEPEVRDSGEDVEIGNIQKDARKNINKEARIAAFEYLSRDDKYDCTQWDPETSTNLVEGLVLYNGKPIIVAITSSIQRKLHLHPYVFAELMTNQDNLLLNYGYDKCIHSIDFDETFKENPNVNLIFDKEKVTPKEFAELANRYRFTKKTCFAIENIKYSISDQIKGLGLSEKKNDADVYTDISADDLFDF